MKIIGLIGGISWVSTADYYRLINQGINKQLGGLEFAECLIYSFNYGDIKRNNDSNDWDKTFQMLSKAALHLQDSGASAIILCANTMHNIADRLQAVIQIPLIHIATVTAAAIEKSGCRKVALLGTKFTMELDFFRSKLFAGGIEVLIPGEEDRAFIHQTIFDELGKGIVTAETKARYLTIIRELIAKGADSVILGCTELPLVVLPEDVNVPLFDTTQLHAQAAIDFALG
ncbi:aspartate/glutamate racemase family protein [Flavihumibacter petaseus]|uniref:Aspartate racemase n=1 Tax=Flavihumibacter petaseus NBRC 106054 TaxID=1220578 RepID=A0A0E9MZH0_9BACT|nr:aspartate/glutamate racemase family protein [Flavihumibacter petaseus]GAO42505.1 aspartate racemase [Flavihumibacter petaseus NBRC 106054]